MELNQQLQRNAKELKTNSMER